MDLSSNNFYGTIPSFENGFQKLEVLYLRNNLFDGVVPSSLFTLPSLTYLTLRNNSFIGLPTEIPGNLSTLLQFDLAANNLQGSFPRIIFQLTSLTNLDISSNNLSALEMDKYFLNLKNLTTNLVLSKNSMSINFSSNILMGLNVLAMDSCGLSHIPLFVQNQENLESLALSNNKIDGHIPNWIWMMNLTTLIVSDNLFTAIDQPPPDVQNLIKLERLGLGNNKIDGNIPNWIWSRYLTRLDLSHNLFTGIDQPPPDVQNLYLVDLSSNNLSAPISLVSNLINSTFFSVSRNRLTGEIPESICSSEHLRVLDLSNNELSGEIPACLGKLELSVLNLGGNRLRGKLPLTYSSSLRSVVFNGNMLNGTIPRSLSNCTLLEVLDLGNNQMNDTFPFWLDSLPNLRVLVLRSNSFHSRIGSGRTETPFPKLYVIDISSNRFTGLFPSEYFRKWKGMTEIEAGSSQVKYLEVNAYYHDSLTVTMKGQEVLLSRVLTIFSSFDVSNNKLEGEIGDFGELKSLIVLNLSRNSLAGSIPSSLEKLSQLESLDLSENKLSGEIPQALTTLTFLSVLDLSENRLEGTIPQGRQFNTFPISCYEGNEGLCGLPLQRKCRGHSSGENFPSSNPENEDSDSKSVLDWKFALMGYGSGLVAGLSTGYIYVARNKGWLKNTTKQKRKSRFTSR